MIKFVNRLTQKKGFTLVEVIIVLVIIAILSAVLIPSLTGYIDIAKEKSIIAEARSAYVAAQTTVSEFYAKGGMGAYLEEKKKSGANKYRITKVDDEGNPVIKNGKVQTEMKTAGRISNTTLGFIQTGQKIDLAKDKAWLYDYYMALQYIRYLDSEDFETARYKFYNDPYRLGQKSGNVNTTTAPNFFQKSRDDVAINFYYDENGNVIMMHFAKKGFDKIIEMYPSGHYSIVDDIYVQ